MAENVFFVSNNDRGDLACLLKAFHFVLPVGVALGHVYILLAAAVLVLLGIYYA